MDTVFQMIPDMESDEYHYIKSLTAEFNEDQLQVFILKYREKRKTKDTILIGTLIGLLGFGGIQRFMLDQIALGILYLLTAGLCYVGTIIDLINYKSLTLKYNKDIAYEAMMFAKRDILYSE